MYESPTPLYIIDEENVSFQPRTCNEAIVLFNRMKRKNQVNWEFVPELLQRISRNLNEEEHDRLCEWICNPVSIKPGRPGYFSDLCEQDRVVEEDEKKPDTPVMSHQTPEDHTKLCDTYSDNDDTSVEQDTQPDPEE